jgi:hypothetical protein
MKVAKEQRCATKKMMEPLEEQLEKAQADLKGRVQENGCGSEEYRRLPGSLSSYI